MCYIFFNSENIWGDIRAIFVIISFKGAIFVVFQKSKDLISVTAKSCCKFIYSMVRIKLTSHAQMKKVKDLRF